MTEVKTPSIAILYWGTRGGPVRQLQNLMASAHSNNLQAHWIISANIRGLDARLNHNLQDLFEVHIPKNKIKLSISFFKKHTALKRTIRYLKVNNIQKIFFLLPHPWDVSLSKKLKRQTDIEIWRGVHDLETHPGDIWPTNRAIRQILIAAHVLVAFSPYIYLRLQNRGKRVVQTEIYEPSQTRILPKPEGKVLFVGRIRKYKGLDFLKKAWPLVNHPNKSLTIAGVGRGVPFEQSQSIDIQNRWLTDEEIESLIDAHRLVVLPYIEASQSGIIPLAHSRGVPVVITPAGGLTGQVLHGVNGIISRSMNDYDFAEAIDTALLMEWNFEQRRDEPLKEFLDVLFELG